MALPTSLCLRQLRAIQTAASANHATGARATPAFNTSVKALQESVKLGRSEELSNRQLFARLQADPKTVERLDMLRLGSEKPGRFERKKWFRYQEPNVRLPHVAFFAGAQAATSFPKETLPEVGIVGRSNVGKSTLINQLCGSAAARVSDKPGLTQQLNFYTADNDFHLVDMPGYGFAFAKEEAQKHWLPLIEAYVRERKTLRRVLVLLDARHGIKANDREFLALLDRTHTKYQLVLTKCDLVHRIDLAKRHLLVSQEVEKSRNCIPRVMLVSARHEAGLNELRKEILHTCSLGQKYLGLHRKKESIAQTEYLEQLKIYKDTARAKRRRQ
ncbi:hypothetical protein GGI04_000037 [Coemansia thaxteri]|uniref:EngB-type G domain-containing protein n=1 Tax=Coemansia thaxteri TaxID=2663907 RepID=A0A9W8EHD3_9FUNG|nr:hypothetical protein H4R26_000962 [Coemansia thaxteri]KAJ2009938.1 hypothetical protein GGI04_000037 [Coemansia thaxteri]KAJ2474276.1 hypothetical protein GGI02_000169 [Coemansia sp. RSA 2322]KAJ2481658.1 hypothetical protein EV174_003410 [Coemansia sp. RSA 2320]